MFNLLDRALLSRRNRLDKPRRHCILDAARTFGVSNTVGFLAYLVLMSFATNWGGF